MRRKCPGQDSRYWKPEDVFTTRCLCGADLEFFKDDVSLFCPSCGRETANPRLDRGCASWCGRADECLGAVTATNSHGIKK